MSRLGRAQAWAARYHDRERRPEMGEAMAFAQEVFPAIEAIITAGGKGQPHLEALAGALAEYRAREVARARAEALAEAKVAYESGVEAAVRALRAQPLHPQSVQVGAP